MQIFYTVMPEGHGTVDLTFHANPLPGCLCSSGAAIQHFHERAAISDHTIRGALQVSHTHTLRAPVSAAQEHSRVRDLSAAQDHTQHKTTLKTCRQSRQLEPIHGGESGMLLSPEFKR